MSEQEKFFANHNRIMESQFQTWDILSALLILGLFSFLYFSLYLGVYYMYNTGLDYLKFPQKKRKPIDNIVIFIFVVMFILIAYKFILFWYM